MSTSYTVSSTSTFTLTHAKYLASKVKADLTRMNRFYGEPSLARIEEFEAELTVLLHGGYLNRVTYGFKRDGEYIEPTLRYTARELLSDGVDDRPGKVPTGANIDGASFHSFLCYSDAWFDLSEAEQQKIDEVHGLTRGAAVEPGAAGYFTDDNSYSAGGRSLGRSSLKGW